jgi:DNA-binding response OmpR family regulator
VVILSTIFVIGGEESSSCILKEYLLREKFRVEIFTSVEEARKRLKSEFADMFILNFTRPDHESLEFCREIRSRSGLPVIVIVDQQPESALIPGLEISADDYLIRPFSPREVISQVRSLFRSSPLPAATEEIITAGNLEINLNDRHITVDDQEVLLTPMEYEFLLLLVQQPQRSFNRQELLDRVWGCDYVGSPRAVDDLVKRLRRKLRQSGSSKNVKTIWGYGYRFEE